MEKTLRMSLLYDFYGPLLTERQRDVYQMYFHEDLSLGEIGEELGVSRQAIYDNLKRAETTLEDFEAKLGLIAKHEMRQNIYAESLVLLEKLANNDEERKQLITELKDNIIRAQATS